jgi:hypothetical protein
MPDEPVERLVAQILTRTHDLYSRDEPASLLAGLAMEKAVREAGTERGTEVGARAHLVNKDAARRMRDLNTTHATCIDAKRASSVGMGHRDQEIHDVLDPLCRFGWQDVLDATGDDYFDHGDGFVEVVWDEGRNNVLGLNHMDGADVHVVIEQQDRSEEYHYQVTSGGIARETVAMAAFGDLLALRARYEANGGMVRNGLSAPGASLAAPLGGRIVNSEVIQFRMSSSRDPYQGYPDWVAATPPIELAQALVRHEFDFHFNRGVPELLVTFFGHKFNNDDWNAIKGIFAAGQGLGNSRKTAAIQIPSTTETAAVQVDKLAMDGTRDEFGPKADALAMLIATAHGVPPLLANILLPGKIGAANEGPNALLLFQKRKLGQVQRMFSRVLAATIGSGVALSQVKGGAKRLTADQFLGKAFEGKQIDEVTQMPIYHEQGNGFKTVLDGMTLGAQQTMASMKEPLAGSGRNPADGLLEGADDRKPGDPRKSR